MVRIDKILETYTLEEILEYNDLTEEEVLSLLLEQDIVQLPTPTPVDL